MNLSFLHFPSPPCHLSIHLPNFYRPADVCAPVWLLAWSVWTLRRRKTRQVQSSWEELQGLGRKSACEVQRSPRVMRHSTLLPRLSPLTLRDLQTLQHPE
ncbi:unnamed protein product [Pleuronectes platessa]|uniref:Uncharacterized protein n=1 Tax=Pleuronectes platessa TaxID=8262 RepID=A0A9N7TMU7_PLEPL|nr:unnamed protein product [Pleuronectes platessa]